MELYVSDLDGTLLNSDQVITEESVRIINSLIAKGMNFTVATARSIDSAGPIIASLNLQLPIIHHNGVFVYDPVSSQNIKSNLMSPELTGKILGILENFNIYPLVFTTSPDNENRIFYKGIFNKGEEHYIKGRLEKGDRRFIRADDYAPCLSHDIISIVAIGEDTYLSPIYSLLKQQFGLTFHYGEDIYSKAFWLEVSHKDATKKSAVEFLKSYLNAEKLICFGDNLNDCSMFEAADYKYAVSNAHEALKKAATRIIDSNNENGVAKFLQSTFSSGKLFVDAI